MSIAFRSGPNESGASTDTAVITLTDVQPGDGIVCEWLMDGSTYDVVSIVATGDQAPENLTLLPTHGPNVNISATAMGGAYRKATAHTGTVVLTITVGGHVGGSLAAWAAAITGHDPVDFYDDDTDVYAEGSSAAPQVTLETNVPNCALFGIMNNRVGGASAGSGVAGTAIVAMTDRHWNDDGLRVLDAGAAGVKNLNATLAGAGEWGLMAFAVKPAVTGPTITDAGDESFRVGETGVNITVTGAGSTQGTGFVRVCPTDDIDDVNGVNLTVTGWSSTLITVDIPANLSGQFPRNTDVYLFVQNDAGASNAAGYVVRITPPAAVLAYGARLLG